MGTLVSRVLGFSQSLSGKCDLNCRLKDVDRLFQPHGLRNPVGRIRGPRWAGDFFGKPEERMRWGRFAPGFLERANNGRDFLPAAHLLNRLRAPEGQEMNEWTAPFAALCLEGIFCLSKLTNCWCSKAPRQQFKILPPPQRVHLSDGAGYHGKRRADGANRFARHRGCILPRPGKELSCFQYSSPALELCRSGERPPALPQRPFPSIVSKLGGMEKPNREGHPKHFHTVHRTSQQPELGIIRSICSREKEAAAKDILE